MARPKNPSPPLRTALATAALRLARDEGAESITVRAVASKADVSANAPYHHFPGGADELLAAAAIAGFDQLREIMQRPPVAFRATDRAAEIVCRYVQFGVENARLYRAMFHARLARWLEGSDHRQLGESTYAQLRALKEDTYEDLVAPLARMGDEGVLRGAPDPRGAPGLAFAALAHGLVGEFIDEGLLLPATDEAPWTADRLAMTTEVTEVLLLGLLGDSAPDRKEQRRTADSLAPEDDPSWRAYQQSILEFFPGERPVVVDLRRAFDAKAGERLHDRGLPETFAVLTACNPRGRTASDEESGRRDRDLRARLRRDGQMWMPADGVSVDGRHREPGVAVAVTQDEARRLARDLEQSAFYWYDGSAFWLIGALVGSPPTRLPTPALHR